MQNVEPVDFPVFFGDGAVRLRGKELLAAFGREQVFLREGDAFFHNLVPDVDHRWQVGFVVLSDEHAGNILFFVC